MGCENSVRETLSNLTGVEGVVVDRKNQVATLTLKEQASISKETVISALSQTKFKVTSFEAK